MPTERSVEFKKNRSRKIEVGDVFMLPLIDGRYVYGQVIFRWRPKVICVAVFDHLTNGLTTTFPDVIGSVMSLPSVPVTEVSSGRWPKIGNLPAIVDYRLTDFAAFAQTDYVGARIYTGNIIEALVNAFYGLADWEPYRESPGLLRSLLCHPSNGKYI